MRWLHISDLHYSPAGQNYDTRKMLEKLELCIEDIVNKGLAVHDVFFTGDFRFAKTPGSVTAKQAADEVRKIAQLAGGNTPARVHIVPGNHDLERLENNDDGKTPLLDSVFNQYSNGEFHGKVNQGGTYISCQDYLLNRFEFFKEVSKELGDPIWKDTKSFHCCDKYDNYKIIYLNTAIACGRDDERGKLVIGYEELYRTLEQYPRDLTGIALGHHGLENFTIVERNKIKDIFKDYNIRLYLCGDAHQGDGVSVDRVVQVTAGSLKLEHGVDSVFFIGEYSDNGDIVIEAYKYDNYHPGWNYNKSFSDSIAERLPPTAKASMKIENDDSDFQHEQPFIGRITLVEQLMEVLSTFSDEIANNMLAIIGEPGIGKTEFCKEILIQAKRRNTNCTIHYIDLTGVLSLDDMAQRMSNKLGLISKNNYYIRGEEKTYYEHIFSELFFYSRSRHLTIFYFDNFEDLLWNIEKEEKEYVINWMHNICKRNSKIVLSSREYDVAFGTIVELQPLELEHSRELFINNWNGDRLIILEKAIADGSLDGLLVSELSNHPLTVVLTANQGRYVATFNDLIRNWRSAKIVSPNIRHNSLYTALRMSWDSIKNKEWAKKLWGIVSLFDDDLDSNLLENHILPKESIISEHKNALISNNLVRYKKGKLTMLNPIKGFCFEFDESDLLAECIEILHRGFCKLLEGATEEETDKKEKHNIVINSLSYIICFQSQICNIKNSHLSFELHENMQSYYQYMPVESYGLLENMILTYVNAWSEMQVISLYENISHICYLLDLPEESKEYCQLALELCNKIQENSVRRGHILTSSASLSIWRSELSDAEAMLDEAIDICERENNENGKANALYSKAELEIHRNQIQKAENYFVDAKALYLKTKNNIGLGNVCRSLGDLKSKSNREEAEKFYDEAEKFFFIDSDLLGLANVDLGRAKMYNRIDESYLSEKYYKNALNCFKQTTDYNNYAKLLFMFGKKATDHLESAEYYIMGIKAYEQIKKYKNCSIGTLRLVEILVLNDRLDELRDALSQCKTFLKLSDDNNLEIYIKTNIQRLLIQKGLIEETGISSNCCKELEDSIKDVLVPNVLFLNPKHLKFIVSLISRDDNGLDLHETLDKLIADIDERIAKLEREEQLHKSTFTIIDSVGNEVLCEVLFTFQNSETEKNYIVFTDNTTDDVGNTKVYANIYYPDGTNTRLDPLETEDEWTTIENILSSLQTSISRNSVPIEEVISRIEANLNNIDEKEQNQNNLNTVSSAAYHAYSEGDSISAERLFLAAIDIIEKSNETLNNPNIYINLGYMKRRGETRQTDISVFDLLKETPHNSGSAVRIINLALCYLTGIECRIDYDRALQLIKGIKSDLTDAISWWSNEELVGHAESNIVMLLLDLAGFIQPSSDDSLSQRIRRALNDGYALSDNL